MRVRLGPSALFLAACGAFAAAITARRLGDFDLPWHLATGRVIAQTHQVPKIDPLAFTHEPLRYVEPLGDLASWGLYRAFGPLGLQMIGGAVAWIVAATLFAHARKSAVTFGLVALVLAALAGWLVVRPATISFAFIAYELMVLERHRRAPDEPRARIGLATLPLVALVWGNVHGFVAFGVWLLLGYFGYRVLSRYALGRWARAEDGRALGATALVAVATVVAGCVNPGGPRLLLGPARFGEDLGGIADFTRTSWTFFLQNEPLPLVVAVLGIVALLVRSEERVTLWDVGLVTGGLAGYALVIRTIPLGMLLVASVIVRRLGAAKVRPALAWALAFTPLLAAAQALIHADTSAGIGFEPSHFPGRAVAWVERASPRGRMWNFWPYGGYLAFTLYPDHLVLMDGRNALARSPELTRRVHASGASSSAFESLVAQYDLQWAIVSARESERQSAPIAQSPAWTMVHLDDVAAVYVRREGPNAPLAAGGFRVLRHLTPPDVVLQMGIEGTRAQDLAHDGALARAQDPESARAAFYAVCGALAMRDRAQFGQAWAAFKEIAPEHPAAAMLLQTGRELMP